MTAPGRIAVGGRSYGAFSSASLLIHSDRFATAIAMSGASNRSLTLFGFQHEKRSFWEATGTYTSISPFFHADRTRIDGGRQSVDPRAGSESMMRAFIQSHLDPASRLGEVLFGLIMALGFTGAVRLGHEAADNRELFIGILGCNLSWAIVDGIMYALTALFERGRKMRLLRSVLAAPTEEAALQAIADEIDGPIIALTTPDELRRLHLGILALVCRSAPDKVRFQREDWLGAFAVTLIIAVSTLPIVAPYLVFADPDLAVRVSHGIALGMLFLLGVRWGQLVGASPFAIGAGLTLVGSLLVLLTIAMGG